MKVFIRAESMRTMNELSVIENFSYSFIKHTMSKSRIIFLYQYLLLIIL